LRRKRGQFRDGNALPLARRRPVLDRYVDAGSDRAGRIVDGRLADAGLVGIAAAPDFTDWGFSQEEKLKILSDGKLEEPSPYGPEPTITTRAFWQSGEANRMLQGPIAIDRPVRLLHGQRDPDVPWHHSPHLASLLRSDDVQVVLIKDGDHRLSRDSDIALLLRTVEAMLEPS
jgi:pimeloyl-ACP methyl ester carboxylesterase